jgi:hypothetical protein
MRCTTNRYSYLFRLRRILSFFLSFFRQTRFVLRHTQIRLGFFSQDPIENEPREFFFGDALDFRIRIAVALVGIGGDGRRLRRRSEVGKQENGKQVFADRWPVVKILVVAVAVAVVGVGGVSVGTAGTKRRQCRRPLGRLFQEGAAAAIPEWRQRSRGL